jgi:predicted small secreted protein
MKKTTAFTALALACVLAGCNTWQAVKQDAKDVGEAAGRGIQKAGQATGDGIQKAGEKIKDVAQ